MTLMQHLYELRTRLFKAAIAIVAIAILAFIFFPQIFNVLTQPYCRLPPNVRSSDITGGCQLIAYNVFDQFNVRIKVSLIVAVVISSPIWLFQLWKFVTPALHRHERRYAMTFTALGSLLFFAGAALAYVVLGTGLELLLTVGGGQIKTLLTVPSYLGYVVAMVVVFGLAFEFPLIMVMLNLTGVLPYAKMIKWWRGIIFAIFLFTAVATPSPSPWEMSILAAVMCLLFGAVLIFARSHDKRKEKRLAVAGLAGLSDDETSPLPDEASEHNDEDRNYTDIS